MVSSAARLRQGDHNVLAGRPVPERRPESHAPRSRSPCSWSNLSAASTPRPAGPLPHWGNTRSPPKRSRGIEDLHRPVAEPCPGASAPPPSISSHVVQAGTSAVRPARSTPGPTTTSRPASASGSVTRGGRSAADSAREKVTGVRVEPRSCDHGACGRHRQGTGPRRSRRDAGRPLVPAIPVRPIL